MGGVQQAFTYCKRNMLGRRFMKTFLFYDIYEGWNHMLVHGVETLTRCMGRKCPYENILDLELYYLHF